MLHISFQLQLRCVKHIYSSIIVLSYYYPFQSPTKGATIPYHPSLTNISTLPSSLQAHQKEEQEILTKGYEDLIEQSNIADSTTSLDSFATVSTAIHPTDESVIFITSPYTNGLTVPAIINPNATSPACLLAMPTPAVNMVYGSVGQGEISCSSMTSPPITPPQTGPTSTTSYAVRQNAPSSVSFGQHNSKDGSMSSSAKLVLSNSQTASRSQVQGNNYIPIASPAAMIYPAPQVGISMPSSLTKPTFTTNQHSNPQAIALPSSQLQQPAKNISATNTTIVSPPATPFLDPQLMCIPTATANLNDPIGPTYNQSFSPMYGSPCQNTMSTFPPQSAFPFISGLTNGIDFSNGGVVYPNHYFVSNNPGDTQCLNFKNGGGYLSPGNSPSPYSYQPSINLPSPSAVHVTSDRSVYSSSLSDVSLI